jgi:predicted nucleic acid-binding protein
MAGIEKPSRVVVLDAGPLIHLDELGSLGLLADHFELLVPDAVWNEVEQHRPALFVSSSLYFRRTTPRSAQDPSLAAISILYPLHLGETQALQIAMECEADMLLTDDTAARLAANQLRIPVHGTLGILSERFAHVSFRQGRSSIYYRPYRNDRRFTSGHHSSRRSSPRSTG